MEITTMEDKKQSKLEELTKEEFEHNISDIVQSANSMITSAMRLLQETEYYKTNGYRIKYYYNVKDNAFSYTFSKIDIGFKPLYKKK